jgi:hypothetical protein
MTLKRADMADGGKLQVAIVTSSDDDEVDRSGQ